jgi:hypothetical protein
MLSFLLILAVLGSCQVSKSREFEKEKRHIDQIDKYLRANEVYVLVQRGVETYSLPRSNTMGLIFHGAQI